MKLKPSDLEQISRKTLDHYESRAAEFWAGTKDHDVTQNYRALLDSLPQDRPLDILDFGCGPGRDLAYFKSLGHRAVGLEGSANFCRMAREYSGCEVWQQDFLRLNLPAEVFDGIFANASLFHVPSQELPRVLRELWSALRPGGILFTSNPRGSQEGWDGQRYGAFMEFEEFKGYLEAAGFAVQRHYYRPAGRPCSEQPWLAVVSAKHGK
ncbi:MAG TPA: class I SAM-dependent methyltransferase [bacterium]|nr:class I SAM-dependent methyltransferase [bacterium]